MELSSLPPAEHAACECWIYTPGDGLRHVTVEKPATELSVGGQRLRSWCILDPTATGAAVVVIYSAELPAREVRRTATRLSRECFRHRPSLALTL
jgi:hypothetical protein